MAVGVAYQNYSLTQEGNLEASYPDFEGPVTHIYNKTDFCLIYLQVILAAWQPPPPHILHFQVNYTGEQEIDLDISFRVCYAGEEQKEGQEFTYIFYPAALLVSSLFLLLTLIAYILDPELHRPLFGKITLAFVCNNLVAYLCLSFVYLSDHVR